MAHRCWPSCTWSIAGRDSIELTLARAAGATWLDDWLQWREVTLDITGADLTAAGLSGPAVGRGLEAALTAKLDGNMMAAINESQRINATRLTMNGR